MYTVFYWLMPFVITLLVVRRVKRWITGAADERFQITIHTRHGHFELPPATSPLALGAGADEDTDEPDNRNLRERLTDAGFVLLEKKRGLRMSDVGAIMTVRDRENKCHGCSSKKVHCLSEVYLSQAPGKDTPIGQVALQQFASVCERCGHVVAMYAASRQHGKLTPLTILGVNFFDVLAYFEDIEDGDAEGAAAGADAVLLEQRREQLEAELGTVRTAIMRKKHQIGEGDALREADRTLAPATPDDQPLPDLGPRAKTPT